MKIREWIPTIWLITFWIIVILFFVQTVKAADPNYPDIMAVEYVRNYDADTVTVNIHTWPKIIGHKISVRVNGIDTPEIRGGTEYSKNLAKQAKLFVELILKCAQNITLKNPQRGKYFRIVADIEIDGNDLGQVLIKLGYAKAYDGKSARPDWSTPE